MFGGAAAASGPPLPLRRWVLVGSGGFWWVLGCSEWVLELKTTPLKLLKFMIKDGVLGSGGCKMEPKWTPKVHYFES